MPWAKPRLWSQCEPPGTACLASSLRSLYQELPRSDTFCRITGTIKPVSLPARQLPPTRTRKWHARLTSNAQTRFDQTVLGLGPPSPRCLTSYRVSPACWFRELAQNLPRTLARFKVFVPFLPEFLCRSHQRDRHISPRLDPTPDAHLSMCVGPWSETRHDRPCAVHLFSFQRRVPSVLPTIGLLAKFPPCSR